MNTQPEPTDELLAQVSDALTRTAESPSAIARKAKVTTAEAATALRWLAAHDFAAVSGGNGAWTKYSAR